MDRDTLQRETAVHRQVYETHREQIRRDCAGKYVVLAQGQVRWADSFQEAQAVLRQLQPVPEFYLIFPGNREPRFEPFYDYHGEG